MSPVNTPEPTQALSLSVDLDGCVPLTNGLRLPDTMAYPDWLRVGEKLSRLNRAAIWMLGDWLAYGHAKFGKEKWNSKEPVGLYEQVSKATGYSVRYLRNASSVCGRFNLSLRSDRVGFNHALEICAAEKDPKKIAKLATRVVDEGLTVVALRSEIRKQKAERGLVQVASFGPSFLEDARQFARDFMHEVDDWTPEFKAEVKKILTPVLARLSS